MQDRSDGDRSGRDPPVFGTADPYCHSSKIDLVYDVLYVFVTHHSARSVGDPSICREQSDRNRGVNYYNDGIIIIIAILQNKYMNV